MAISHADGCQQGSRIYTHSMEFSFPFNIDNVQKHYTKCYLLLLHYIFIDDIDS